MITIVMPVRNEARFIGDTLTQLVTQDYPANRYEIIVADGMSDDGTRRIVADFAREHKMVKLMDNPGCLSSAGRNIGFKNGRGDIFLVVDGHCHMPDNQLFNNIANAFERSSADCLGRPQPLNPPGLSSFQKAVALARNSRIGHSGNSLIYSDYEGFASPVSNGAVYKSRVFAAIGYVDENFDACEDVEFNYRVGKAGLKSYTSPSLTIKYYPRENLKSLLRQMIRYGRGRCKFIKKHPETFNIDMMVTPLFVSGLFLLLSSCFSALLFPNPEFKRLANSLFFLILLPYCIYAALIGIESLRIAFRKGFRYLKFLPPIFFTVHFGLGFGFIKQFIQDAYHRNPALKHKIDRETV